jgi:hypothetical protein
LRPQGTSEADGPALAALLAARRMAAPEIVRCHQDFSPPDAATAPVGEPIEKDRAKLQARGRLSAARVPQTPDAAAPACHGADLGALFSVDASCRAALPVVARVWHAQRTALAPSAAAIQRLYRRSGPPFRDAGLAQALPLTRARPPRRRAARRCTRRTS